ncbi:hypothetical protein [Streptomyces sp. enrichment culture]|uniref:hypothetical protein n=1 Tax=Streptomyces sp. enrichment culture TaxID=1795815 RepID=UPI003F56E81B
MLPPVWEASHGRDVRRRSRKAVPLAALVVFRARDDHGRLMVALSVLEALAVAGPASQVVRFARAA